jgi:hypothetical protein
MTAIEAGKGHSRPALWAVRQRPAWVAIAGLLLLLAAWLSDSGTSARNPRPVDSVASMDVVIPTRDRAAIRDWCSFFSNYGLRTASTDDRIARPTLLRLYEQDPSLTFPTNSPIRVFFNAPPASKVDSAGDKAVSATLRQCDRGM